MNGNLLNYLNAREKGESYNQRRLLTRKLEQVILPDFWSLKYKQSIEKSRVHLVSTLNTHVYFSHILLQAVVKVWPASNSENFDLSVLFFDLMFEIEDELDKKYHEPGVLYIPSVYFSFIGNLRECHGLYGYGYNLEPYHLYSSTDTDSV